MVSFKFSLLRTDCFHYTTCTPGCHLVSRKPILVNSWYLSVLFPPCVSSHPLESIVCLHSSPAAGSMASASFIHLYPFRPRPINTWTHGVTYHVNIQNNLSCLGFAEQTENPRAVFPSSYLFRSALPPIPLLGLLHLFS